MHLADPGLQCIISSFIVHYKSKSSADGRAYLDEFFDHIESTVSKEKPDEYRAAKQRIDNAAYEYDNFDVPTDVIDIFETEIDRLAAQGYEIDRFTLDARAGRIKAYLTKVQIDNFSINPKYAYLIFFANERIAMLEK